MEHTQCFDPATVITSTNKLPTWLNEMLGLTDYDNQVLVRLNDTKRYDFNTIANILVYAETHGVSIQAASHKLEMSFK